jgi:hypothetical protein
LRIKIGGQTSDGSRKFLGVSAISDNFAQLPFYIFSIFLLILDGLPKEPQIFLRYPPFQIILHNSHFKLLSVLLILDGIPTEHQIFLRYTPFQIPLHNSHFSSSILLLILLGFEEFQNFSSLKFDGCCTEQHERDSFVLSGFNREAKQILRGSFFLLLLEHFQMHIKVVLESCMKQRTCLETFFFPFPFWSSFNCHLAHIWVPTSLSARRVSWYKYAHVPMWRNFVLIRKFKRKQSVVKCLLDKVFKSGVPLFFAPYLHHSWSFPQVEEILLPKKVVVWQINRSS